MISSEQEKQQTQKKKKLSRTSSPTPPPWTSNASDGSRKSSGPRLSEDSSNLLSHTAEHKGLDYFCILQNSSLLPSVTEKVAPANCTFSSESDDLPE